jgi:hypothetical protein
MQDTRRVRADLDAGAYLAQGPRALIDMNIRAHTQQRKRRGYTADAATYDRYGECLVLHGIAPLHSDRHRFGANGVRQSTGLVKRPLVSYRQW